MTVNVAVINEIFVFSIGYNAACVLMPILGHLISIISQVLINKQIFQHSENLVIH